MTPVWAQKIYGRVVYDYNEQTSESDSYDSSTEIFTQRYELGYRSHIYSPKLLEYDIFGAFNQYLTDNENGGAGTKSRQNQYDYRGNLSFLQATRYPFQLSVTKNTSPNWVTNLDNSGYSLSESSSYALSGSADLHYFTLGYGANTGSSTVTAPAIDLERATRGFNLNAAKTFADSQIGVNYSDQWSESRQTSKTGGYDSNLTDRVVNSSINHSWDVSDTLRWYSTAQYYQYDYADMKNIALGTNLAWNPTQRYALSGGLNAGRMEGGTGSSLFQYDTLMGTLSSTYRVSENFSTSQTATFYRMDSNASSSSTEIFAASGDYRTRLAPTREWQLSGTVDAQFNSTQNMGATDWDERYGVSLNSRISEEFPSIKGRGSVGVGGSAALTAKGASQKTWSGMASFGWTPITGFSYSAAMNYTYSLYETAGTATAASSSITEAFAIYQNAGYTGQLGRDGSYSLNAGVNYVQNRSGPEDTESLQPQLQGSLNYRLFSSTLLNSSISVSQDTLSDLTNYSAFLGLNTRIRQIFINMGTRYFLQEAESGEMYTNQSIYINASRNF